MPHTLHAPYAARLTAARPANLTSPPTTCPVHCPLHVPLTACPACCTPRPLYIPARCIHRKIPCATLLMPRLVHAPPTACPNRCISHPLTSRPLQVHDFSKMLFGIAGLMPDMVRAVPVWIDDPLIQRVLYANVLEHGAANSDTLPPQFASAASTYFADEGSLLQQEAAGMLEASPSEGGPAVSPKVQWGQAPGPDVQNGGSSKTLFGIAGWQAKLAERVRNNVYQSRSQVREGRRERK